MLTIDWDDQKGWHEPQIRAYGPLKVSPTATCLHYGISAYEGIGSVLNEDGVAQAFKAEQHLNSFYNSCEHLAMPLFDKEQLLECIKELVKVDKDWYKDGSNKNQVYIRLCHISTDEVLGVKAPAKTTLFVFLNPNTMKFKNRKVKCAYNVIKNWPMGHGAYRISGNFGPLIPVVKDAKDNGFDDVLWLIDDYVKELTILNVFFLW